jgi:hypothetical protein
MVATMKDGGNHVLCNLIIIIIIMPIMHCMMLLYLAGDLLIKELTQQLPASLIIPSNEIRILDISLGEGKPMYFKFAS